MKTVRVTMSDEAFAKLGAEVRKKQLPGISTLLLKNSNVDSDEAIGADIAKKAVKLAQKKSDGEKFKLKDLFNSDDWNQYPKGARVYAGRNFFESVSNNKVSGVVDAGKSTSNHQYYEKT